MKHRKCDKFAIEPVLKDRTSGVYMIQNLANLKVYIGVSGNLRKRMYDYRSGLGIGQTRLQRSFLKHGIENHAFIVLEFCKPEELDGRERHYVDLYKSVDAARGYNCQDGGLQSYKRSEETVAKFRKTKGEKYGVKCDCYHIGSRSFIGSYQSASEAGRALGVNYKSIFTSVYGASADIGGYYFCKPGEVPDWDTLLPRMKRTKARKIDVYDLCSRALVGTYPSSQDVRRVFGVSHGNVLTIMKRNTARIASGGLTFIESGTAIDWSDFYKDGKPLFRQRKANRPSN